MDDLTPDSERRGLIALFARNPVAANMLMVLFIGGGILAANLLPVQSFPDFDPRVVTVTVPYPGAMPEEIEDSITTRVEERVRDIAGVRSVRSSAREGVGTVVADLETFADADDVRGAIQTAVDGLQNFPPTFAESPRIGFPEIMRNVAMLVVSSETASETDLRRAAELLRDELLRLPTVSSVDLFGTRDYETSIEVSEELLLRNDLTIEEVADAVRQASVNEASGELHTDAGGLVIRTYAKRKRAQEFGDIPVLSQPDGTLVRLRDVASVRDGFRDTELLSQMDGRPAVFLRIREADAGDPQILPAAADALAVANGFELPEGIQVAAWEDGSQITRFRLDAMVGNALMGCALVLLLLVVVLDLRLALWVTIGIPVSFLGGLLLFDPFGLTVNSTTLFALVLVTGIVVDDAIVVGESIAAQREAGKTGVAAAVDGARAVVGPVVTGVITTMVAFAPLLFAPGVVGQILNPIALVVIAVLAVSLFEAFMILPAHLGHGRNWSRPPLADVQDRGRRWLESLRDNVVVGAVSAVVLRPWVAILASVAFLVLAALLVATSAVRFILFDAPTDVDRLRVQIAFPLGTPFEVTRAAVDRVVGAAHAVDIDTGDSSFRSIGVVVGGQFDANAESYMAGSRDTVYASHLASVVALLEDEPARSLSPSELVRRWRSRVGAIQGAERVSYSSSSIEVAPDVSYVLTHPDSGVLERATAELQATYDREPAIYGTRTSLAEGKRQIDIRLNEIGLAAGISARDVARQLRARFRGAEVQRNQFGRDEAKVVVRYPIEERLDLADLIDERIALRAEPPLASIGGAQGTTSVPLAIIAEIVEIQGFASIDHVDGTRSASVSAWVDTALSAPNEIVARLEEDVLPALQDRHAGLRFSRADQLELQDRLAEILLLLVPVALLVIYGLIAAQLKSYTQPLIVMAAVPFAAAGAVVGHFLLGYDLMSYSVFGMVAIGGVVVNDALVLLDRYNRIRSGLEVRADVAVIAAAARHRFRAIILTTVTTLLALLPTLYSNDPVVLPLIPVVVSLVFGLLFASAILLFFVPALLALVEGAQERLAAARGRGSQSAA